MISCAAQTAPDMPSTCSGPVWQQERRPFNEDSFYQLLCVQCILSLLLRLYMVVDVQLSLDMITACLLHKRDAPERN